MSNTTQALQAHTLSALGSLGLSGDPQGVATLLAAFGPVANVALIDYGLMIAALTATVLILICVVLLTDVQRQRTLPYWSNVLFLVTGCVNYALLIASYYTIFLGAQQSIAVVILFCVFGSLSRTISDWVLMLRVRKSFPTANLLLFVGLTLIVARFAMELAGRISYNVATINNDPVTFFILQSSSPTVLIRIYPWFTAAMDAFFALVFIRRFFQKLSIQRKDDANVAREVRWYHSTQLMAREQNIAPAIASVVIAIVQAFSLDPNRYAAISLLVTVCTTPFATVWRILETKFQDGDPATTLLPLAQNLAQNVGRPLNVGNGGGGGGATTATATTATVQSFPSSVTAFDEKSSGGSQLFEQALGLIAAGGAQTGQPLQQAASLNADGKLGSPLSMTSGKTTTAMSVPLTDATSTANRPVPLVHTLDEGTDTLAFKVVKAAADATTSVEHSKVGQAAHKAQESVDTSLRKVGKVVSSHTLPLSGDTAAASAAGQITSPGPASPTLSASGKTKPSSSGSGAGRRLHQIGEALENVGQDIVHFIDESANAEAEASGSPDAENRPFRPSPPGSQRPQ